MILRDKLEIIEARVRKDEYGNTTKDWSNPVVVASLPAQVDYRSTAVTVSGSSSFRITEQLTALVRRFDFNQNTQRIRWRGLDYAPDGSEKVVTAAGRVHHVEIPLVRRTG